MPFKDKEKDREYKKQYRLDNKEKAKQYYLNNKEKAYEYNKQYRLDNKEKIKETNKQYRLNNRETIKERDRQFYSDNKEKAKEYRKTHYLNNKEKAYEYNKQYRLDNKEKIREYRNQWSKERKKSDPLFRFAGNCRSRTNMAFKAKSWIKNGGTEKLLGCDWKTAMNHIEKQFESWMNWDNHGEWHIDHIIPLASANTIEEMTPLFNYKNLQPLLAEDNIRKGDKIL